MLRRHAHQEAVVSLRRALALLRSIPESLDSAPQELTLQILLGVALMSLKGFAAPEVETAYTRARELCQRVGKTPQIFPVLVGLHAFYAVRGELQTGWEINEQLFHLTKDNQDQEVLLEAHLCRGNDSYFLGNCIVARRHFEEALTLYNREQHGAHAFIYGQDPEVVAHSALSWTLWHLGYPDQALQQSHEALTLASELAHAPSSAFAFWYATVLHGYHREWSQVRRVATELHVLSSAQGLPLWLALGMYGQGWGETGGQCSEEVSSICSKVLLHIEALAQLWEYRVYRLGWQSSVVKLGASKKGKGCSPILLNSCRELMRGRGVRNYLDSKANCFFGRASHLHSLASKKGGGQNSPTSNPSPPFLKRRRRNVSTQPLIALVNNRRNRLSYVRQ